MNVVSTCVNNPQRLASMGDLTHIKEADMKEAIAVVYKTTESPLAAELLKLYNQARKKQNCPSCNTPKYPKAIFKCACCGKAHCLADTCIASSSDIGKQYCRERKCQAESMKEEAKAKELAAKATSSASNRSRKRSR